MGTGSDGNHGWMGRRTATLHVMRAAVGGFIALFQALGGDGGCGAEYLGGTLETLRTGTEGALRTSDPLNFVFQTRREALRIPYERINQVEYGQQVDRRLLEAILISPLLILSKKRKHFLTVGFELEDGRQQALVFQVDKKSIRTVLVCLEARTGRRVVYQDEEARKAGKG